MTQNSSIFFEILTQTSFSDRMGITVLARFWVVFVDGQNGFCPFLPSFLLRAKRIMPVFGAVFVRGQMGFAHLHFGNART